jgi:ankyrin repeat protein
MVDWLVQKGCPLNFIDLIGQTCLFYASRDGKLSMVKHLLKKGIDASRVDQFGQTAFFYACREG